MRPAISMQGTRFRHSILLGFSEIVHQKILTPIEKLIQRFSFNEILYTLTRLKKEISNQSRVLSIDMAPHRLKLPLRAALAAFVAFAAFGAQAAHAGDAKHLLRPLVESSARRLAIGDQVALSKWDSGTSVEDPARESVVISNAVTEGQRSNLAADDVTRFFKAQIEANKLVQYELLARWRRAGYAPPHTPIDLKGTIRPELDRLQTEMIAELAAADAVFDSKECAKDVARAVGHYAFEHQFDPADLPVLALDRAMAGFCRVY